MGAQATKHGLSERGHRIRIGYCSAMCLESEICTQLREDTCDTPTMFDQTTRPTFIFLPAGRFPSIQDQIDLQAFMKNFRKASLQKTEGSASSQSCWCKDARTTFLLQDMLVTLIS
jgi:hypothetical protein